MGSTGEHSVSRTPDWAPGHTSRALVQRGHRDLVMQNVRADTDLAPDQAVLQLEANGLCGSDVDQFRGHMDHLVTYPVVPGHEPLGRIAAVGEDFHRRHDVEVGDRVFVEPFVFCGGCNECLSGWYSMCSRGEWYGYRAQAAGAPPSGGLADHMVLELNSSLHRVDEAVPTEVAILASPMSAGIEWAVGRGEVSLGDRVLIFGPGPRGLCSAYACAKAGAAEIVVVGLESDRRRLDVAGEVTGAAVVTVGSSGRPELPPGFDNRFDLALDATPMAVEPFVEAVRCVRPGGRVVVAGLKGRRATQLVTDDVVHRGVDIRGALGVRRRSVSRAISLLTKAGDLGPMHADLVPLGDAVEVLLGVAESGLPTSSIQLAVTP